MTVARISGRLPLLSSIMSSLHVDCPAAVPTSGCSRCRSRAMPSALVDLPLVATSNEADVVAPATNCGSRRDEPQRRQHERLFGRRAVSCSSSWNIGSSRFHSTAAANVRSPPRYAKPVCPSTRPVPSCASGARVPGGQRLRGEQRRDKQHQRDQRRSLARSGSRAHRSLPRERCAEAPSSSSRDPRRRTPRASSTRTTRLTPRPCATGLMTLKMSSEGSHHGSLTASAKQARQRVPDEEERERRHDDVTGLNRRRDQHGERHDDAHLEPDGERALEQHAHRLAVHRSRRHDGDDREREQ